jgi:hypothetical protein
MTTGRDAHLLARELLTAQWTAFERRTSDAAEIYAQALDRACASEETAATVIHNLITFCLTATMENAGFRGVPYEEVLVDLFKTTDDAISDAGLDNGA